MSDIAATCLYNGYIIGSKAIFASKYSLYNYIMHANIHAYQEDVCGIIYNQNTNVVTTTVF